MLMKSLAVVGYAGYALFNLAETKAKDKEGGLGGMMWAPLDAFVSTAIETCGNDPSKLAKQALKVIDEIAGAERDADGKIAVMLSSQGLGALIVMGTYLAAVAAREIPGLNEQQCKDVQDGILRTPMPVIVSSGLGVLGADDSLDKLLAEVRPYIETLATTPPPTSAEQVTTRKVASA